MLDNFMSILSKLIGLFFAAKKLYRKHKKNVFSLKFDWCYKVYASLGKFRRYSFRDKKFLKSNDQSLGQCQYPESLTLKIHPSITVLCSMEWKRRKKLRNVVNTPKKSEELLFHSSECFMISKRWLSFWEGNAYYIGSCQFEFMSVLLDPWNPFYQKLILIGQKIMLFQIL